MYFGLKLCRCECFFTYLCKKITHPSGYTGSTDMGDSLTSIKSDLPFGLQIIFLINKNGLTECLGDFFFYGRLAQIALTTS